MSRFKDPKVQELYDLYAAHPPVGRGSGIASAYQNGLEYPERLARYVRGSLAYAAWAAGVDAAKKIEKSLLTL